MTRQQTLLASGIPVHCAFDELVDPVSLIPNPRNPNRHPDYQIELLARVIKAQGWRAPITVSNRSGFVVRGHGRLQAALRLGVGQVPVDRQDYATEAEEWADLVADNRLAELADVEPTMLRDVLQELSLAGADLELTGYDEAALDRLISEAEAAPTVTEDEIPEPPAVPVTRPGDLWILGRHRLLCGDATDPAAAEQLMAGRLAEAVFTDPPYNVDYEGGTKDRLKIRNDRMDSGAFHDFLLAAFTNMLAATEEGGAIYVCHADSEGINFRTAMVEAGWELKQCLIWVKNTLVLGRQDYHWQHEPILYGWKPGAAHRWYGSRDKATVIDDDLNLSDLTRAELLHLVEECRSQERTTVVRVDKPARNDVHPTMKPVGLVARLLRNSTRLGDLVVDLFLGSGSTLIAAHQMGRSCYGMELDPRYCDVIVKRWEILTGRKAELVR